MPRHNQLNGVRFDRKQAQPAKDNSADQGGPKQAHPKDFARNKPNHERHECE